MLHHMIVKFLGVVARLHREYVVGLAKHVAVEFLDIGIHFSVVVISLEGDLLHEEVGGQLDGVLHVGGVFHAVFLACTVGLVALVGHGDVVLETPFGLGG